MRACHSSLLRTSWTGFRTRSEFRNVPTKFRPILTYWVVSEEENPLYGHTWSPLFPLCLEQNKMQLGIPEGQKAGLHPHSKTNSEIQSHISDSTEHSRVVSQRTGHRGLGLRFILASFTSAAAALRSPQVSRGNHKLLPRCACRCITGQLGAETTPVPH